MASAISILPARSQHDLTAVTSLFEAYAAALDVDLSYQDFATELASLPGKYAPPRGALLLATDDQRQAIGCVALRPMEEEHRCEMKRLFVAPAGRGRGLGRSLVEALIQEAKRIGYRQMCLDTLPTMAAAQGLYRKFGFEPIPAYYASPIEGTAFLGLSLGTASAGNGRGPSI
jgi:ribosomal protein S18 acetylase RimI-like enzyme